MRWRAENVHHFAWTTSNDYTYEGGDFNGTAIHVLYQPGDTAWARGVTVNGLAIINEDLALETWYRDNVIAGQGSFVITAANFDDFAEAIVMKLIKEIEWQDRLSMR